MFAVPFLYSLDSMLKTQCTTNSLKVRPFGVPVLIECIEPEKTIAMLQSNHRNDSLVHSHIAGLQFAFFPFAHRNAFFTHPQKMLICTKDSQKLFTVEIFLPKRSEFH